MTQLLKAIARQIPHPHRQRQEDWLTGFERKCRTTTPRWWALTCRSKSAGSGAAGWPPKPPRAGSASLSDGPPVEGRAVQRSQCVADVHLHPRSHQADGATVAADLPSPKIWEWEAQSILRRLRPPMRNGCYLRLGLDDHGLAVVSYFQEVDGPAQVELLAMGVASRARGSGGEVAKAMFEDTLDMIVARGFDTRKSWWRPRCSRRTGRAGVCAAMLASSCWAKVRPGWRSGG